MSMNPRTYLDFNATAPLVAAARDAIAALLHDAAIHGNPSSIHGEGRRARDYIERARNQVAGLFGRPREQIVFTSGGTEGNSLGVWTLAAIAEQRGLPRVVATTAIEHPSLLGAVRALRGWTVRVLPGDLTGIGVLAVAAVNHELGTLVDPALIPAARAAGALVHVDAVQAAGKLALGGIDADSIAISGHKLGGPQGIGAVALGVDLADAADGRTQSTDTDSGRGHRTRKTDTDTDSGRGHRTRSAETDTDTDADADDRNVLLSVPDTGHQERGRRGGTENLIGIVGFGAVAATIDPVAWRAVADLGDELEAGILRIDGTRIHGADRPRVGGTINAGFAGARGESIVIALDLEGIAASTGAACTSGSVQPSPVLLGLGWSPEQAREAVRFSLGRPTTKAEIDRALAVLPAVVERARKRR